MIESLSPKTPLGLAEVPSLGAVEVGIDLVVTQLDVALDLAKALAADPFFLSSGGGMGLYELGNSP